MKVLLEFEGSHHYWMIYKKTKLFCVNCGKRTVWQEDSDGDYHEGPHTICTSCRYSFSMPRINGPEDDEWGKIIDQIIKGKANKPTTKRGN